MNIQVKHIVFAAVALVLVIGAVIFGLVQLSAPTSAGEKERINDRQTTLVQQAASTVAKIDSEVAASADVTTLTMQFCQSFSSIESPTEDLTEAEKRICAPDGITP